MKNNFLNPGWVERTVRFLIGLPTATAYFYVRHFSMDGAYTFLGLGMLILFTGLLGQGPTGFRKPALQRADSDFRWAKFVHAS